MIRVAFLFLSMLSIFKHHRHTMSEGIGRKEVERSSQVINDGREDRIQEEIVEK